MSILEAYNMPFAAALLAMLVLAVVQIIGVADLFGDAHVEVGHDVSAHADVSGSLFDGLFSVIGLGRIPLMVWLSLYLGLFAGIGVGIQELAIGLSGAPLDRLLAAAITAVATFPVVGVLARPLARILPHDETSAVETQTLLGRRGQVTDGVARGGSPARVRVRDVHGHPHHLMVEPHEPSGELRAGEEVLLVRREGDLFYATPLTERALSPD